MAETRLGSTLKGKIAATLVGMTCALYSDGQINFASPFTDDEAVDLIMFRRGGTGKVILVQVKGRGMHTSLLTRGIFRAQVRRSSFCPREGYYLIFAAFDETKLELGDTVWFIPSLEFERKLAGQKGEKVLVFQSRFDSNDMWKEHRVGLKDLPKKIMQIL